MVPADPAPYRGAVIGTVLRPWRTAQTWRSLCHLSLDGITGAIGFAVVFPLIAVTLSLVVVFPLAIVTSWFLFLVAHAVANVERSRAHALLRLELHDPDATPIGSNAWKRYVWRLRSMGRWKEIGFALLHYPVGAMNAGLMVLTWGGSIGLLLLPAYVRLLPAGTARFYWFDLGTDRPLGLLAASLIGLVGVVVVAPWLTVWLSDLDRVIDRLLLGRTEKSEFEERVTDLQERRVAAVDSAEAERRRIERDLHDGAQQRLIAVAMDLGVARTQLRTDPERAAELVTEAHEEVKAALKELRDLVRGIHPVILEDRGLDAALSAVVARSSVPVTLQVDVSPRPSPAVESAAYFIVSEAMTNVVRHAAATRARVEIARRRRPPHDRRERRRRRWGGPGRRIRSGGPPGPGECPGRLDAGREPGRRTDHADGGGAVRIVIAEDSVLLRAGLTRLLTEHGHDVVGAVGDADALLDAVERHLPDLAIVDVRMPPTHTDDGLRAALVVRERWPQVGILVLSQYVEERYASELLANDASGVGYLLKDRIADVSDFIDAVQRVGERRRRASIRRWSHSCSPAPPDRTRWRALSPREREVLELMAEGRTNSAIAEALVVSDGAVEKHVDQHLHQARPAARRRATTVGSWPSCAGPGHERLRPPRMVGGGVHGGGRRSLVVGPVMFASLIARETTTLSRTFDATGITVLDMQVADGSVLVVGDEVSTIRVEAVVSSGLWDTRTTVAVAGDRLSLGSSCPGPLSHHCAVDWVVHAPPGVRLEGRSSDTDVRVGRPARRRQLRLGRRRGHPGRRRWTGLGQSRDNGAVRATGLGAGPVNATSRDGDLELEFAEPPTAVAATGRDGSVSVVLPSGSGPYDLTASAADGQVTAPVRTDPSSAARRDGQRPGRGRHRAVRRALTGGAATPPARWG